MRIQRACFSSLLALGLTASACSKEKQRDGDKPAEPSGTAAEGTPTAKVVAATPNPGDKKKAAPPDELYEGSGRIVNLAMVDGKPVAIDVWATQSFKYAPVKLAENVAFGEATEWFKSPKGSPVKSFVTGTDPGSKEDLGGAFHPKKGEHITTILYNKEDGSSTNGSYWNTSDDASRSSTPDAPPAGKGYVVFRANQLKPHEKAMKEVTGGWALQVGDGKGTCIHQRSQDMGFQASLLGGTQPIEIDLDPGTQKITFHKGISGGCAEESKVYETELEVKADAAQLVVLYTPDAKVLKHSVYDMPVNSAKPAGTNKKLKEEKDAARAAKKAAKEAEAAK